MERLLDAPQDASQDVNENGSVSKVREEGTKVVDEDKKYEGVDEVDEAVSP